MIYDMFENIKFYCKEGEVLYKAIIYARDFDFSWPDGEYEVEGKNVFAKVMSYETSLAKERKFEAHKEYTDVQVILSGRERMDVTLGGELEPLSAYDETEDVIEFRAPEVYSSIAMEPGMFVVFFSHEIHRPNCNLNGVSKNRKICMKVRV